MKTPVFNVAKRYLPIILISIVGLITLNNILFVHVHKLSNGTLVVHAHPFAKSADTSNTQSHQHSKVEFSVIDCLQVLFASLIGAYSLIVLAAQQIFRFRHTPQVISFLPQHLTNKAPPVLV